MKLIHIISLMICLSILAAPATAYAKLEYIFLPGEIVTHEYHQITKLNFNSTETEAVYQVMFWQKLGTTGNFTITYGSGNTVTAWAYYTTVNPLYSRRAVAINSVEDRMDFWDTQVGSEDKFDISYATNDFNYTGILITNPSIPTIPAVFGNKPNVESFFQTGTEYNDAVITRIEFTFSTPVNLYIYTAPVPVLQKNLNYLEAGATGQTQDAISFALQILSNLFDTLYSLFYWLKFFFVDNLVMTIALYLTVTMAFAARAAKGNIAKFLRTWFKDQVGLFRFIIGLWQSIVDLISSFRGIFRI